MKVKSLSREQLLATPRTEAYQAPPSMGFARQEYWGGVPLPSPLNCIGTIIFYCLSVTFFNGLVCGLIKMLLLKGKDMWSKKNLANATYHILLLQSLNAC